MTRPKAEGEGAYSDWQRWWWGRPWLGGWPIGGFSNALFAFLKRRRARALARRYRWLTDNLESIPSGQLQSIGPYWREFGAALGVDAESFGRALEREAERFAVGLGFHGRDFAEGLGDSVGCFAAGLGGSALAFLEGLGPEARAAFLGALGPRLGVFLRQLAEPEPVFALLDEDLPALLGRLGAQLPVFLEALGPLKGSLFGRFSAESLVGLLCRLKLYSALLLRDPELRALCLGALAGDVEGFARSLGESAGRFVVALGRDAEEVLLALGPGCLTLRTQALDSDVMDRLIASRPRRFGEALRGDGAALAASVNARPGSFFRCLDEGCLGELLNAMGLGAGVFLRGLSDPEPLLSVIASDPRRVLEGFDDAAVEELARGLGPVATLFGRLSGKRSRALALALGSRAGAFGRGLSRHARAFVTGLGGANPRPEPRGWVGAAFAGLVDTLRSNHYTRSFLRGLGAEEREAWFEAIGQDAEIRLQARNRLRCSLCHLDLVVGEDLIQCPSCATVIHRECLGELSRGRCPHDGSPEQHFIPTRLTESESELDLASIESAIVIAPSPGDEGELDETPRGREAAPLRSERDP